MGATVLNFRASVKGRVGRSTARGTLRLRGTVKDSAGKVIDKCDSGVVKWTLHRGHYYGGGTDAGTAVSVRTNR